MFVFNVCVIVFLTPPASPNSAPMAALPSDQTDKTLLACPLAPAFGLGRLQQLHRVPTARELLAGAAVMVEPGMGAVAHVHCISEGHGAGQQPGPRGGS